MKIQSSRLRRLVLAASVGCLGASALHAAVAFTLSTSSVANDFVGTVSLNITGLPTTGQAVLVEKFADFNGNGVVDSGDVLVRSFTVTDGQLPLYGGVRNINQPGDDDGAADNKMQVNLAQPGVDNVFGSASGTFIYRVSGTGFTAVSQPFTVTQHTYPQGIQGHVTRAADASDVAGALVVLLTSPNGNAIGGTFTDSTGHYTLLTPPGDYMVLPIVPGLVTDQSVASATVVASTFTTNNQALAAGTFTISGQLADSNTAAGIPGIFINASSDSNQIVGAFTDASGNYSMSVLPGTWQFDLIENQLAQVGYLRLQNRPSITITTADATNVNIALPKATALIYGTVKDTLANPVNGVGVSSNDQANVYDGVGVSMAPDGDYAIGVLAGTWNVNVQSDGLPAGYISGQGSSIDITAGHAVQSNVVLQQVTAHLQGTVSKSGSPLAGVQVDANLQNQGGGTGVSVVATTDGSGNFDLGVNAGTWSVTLDNNSADSNSLVGPNLTYDVTDGINITGIAYDVLNGTGTISGTVVDALGNPVSNASVNGNAVISAVNYSAGGQTDSGGNYSFPVIAGAWSVNAYANNLTYSQQNATVTGSGSAVVNFSPSVISSQPQNQTVATAGQAIFSIGTDTPGANTIQWQVSTNGGSTWNNLAEGAPYSGTTTATLTVNPVTNTMSGYQFRGVVTYNAGANFENSQAATLTVNATAPNFTQQPTAQTVPAGHTATFTAQVNDGAATFQWEISTDGGTVWNNVTDSSTYGGSTTATLTVTNPSRALNGDKFRVVATDGAQSNSTAVVLTVHYAVADFNGDGKEDIIWSNTTTGDRALWYMNGTAIGTFDYLAYVAPVWHIVGKADFDGDGLTDLIWENVLTGDRSIWLMNGTTIINFPYLAWVDPVWHIAAVGDFNGDGMPDLLWENAESGGVDRAIWYLNGTNVGTFGYLAGVAPEWKIVGAADFDGDGQTDIIWEDTTTGDRSIWLMNGTNINSFVDVGNVAVAWHIAAVGDFDGDGQPDLLWENTTTGDRAIWIMNGTTHASSVYLAYVDPVWSITP